MEKYSLSVDINLNYIIYWIANDTFKIFNISGIIYGKYQLRKLVILITSQAWRLGE